MSSSDDEYVVISDHPENLASGAMVAPGDRVSAEDIGDGDAWLIDDGRLRLVSSFEPTQEEVATIEDGPGGLKGQALDDRAAELEIVGRSEMSADEKRSAIAEHESNTNGDQ